MGTAIIFVQNTVRACVFTSVNIRIGSYPYEHFRENRDSISSDCRCARTVLEFYKHLKKKLILAGIFVATERVVAL